MKTSYMMNETASVNALVQVLNDNKVQWPWTKGVHFDIVVIAIIKT